MTLTNDSSNCHVQWTRYEKIVRLITSKITKDADSKTEFLFFREKFVKT